jgi:hypothetical protein
VPPIPAIESPSRWKHLRLPATVVAAVVLVAACGASIIIGQQATDDVNKLYGGADGLRVVVSPEKVEAFRVGSPRTAKDDTADTIGGAAIISGPVAVDETAARKLAEILNNHATYGWDFAKGCKFDPGIAIRFTGEATTIEVIFCFHCQELQVYREGKKVGGEDFDAASRPLTAIMKRLFPDDGEIQKLRS